MKVFLKLGYIILFLVMIFILYLEYHNYKILNYKIDTSDYVDQIEKLKNNIEIIRNYNIDDYKLMTTINRCNNIRYKEILDKEFIDIVDIYFINKNSANGWCNGSDYGINISYDYNKDINLYQYINLYNDKSIKEAFEKVLNNEINITSAFIEMVEESYNEKV